MDLVLIENKLKKAGYNENEAKYTALGMSNFTYEDLKNAVDKWVEKDVLSEVSEGDYSTSGLMKIYEMKYPAALIFIEWLRDEPEQALIALSCKH